MNLKNVRLQQGLSIPALSRLSSVPVRTIENIERNNDAKVSTVIKLSTALNATLDEICLDK